MTECICKGNWQALVKECRDLIGKKFKNVGYGQETYTFFGLVYGEDDYYYGMYRNNGSDRQAKLRLLSCVGNLETHGYELIETN